MRLALQSYLDMTKDLRGDTDNLLITTRQPYKPATTKTIAWWIKAFLAKCGINSSYKAHRTRHAVTSAALKKGVDINIIKTIAGWSKESLTFAKFYNRPIVPSRENFAEVVIMQNSIWISLLCIFCLWCNSFWIKKEKQFMYLQPSAYLSWEGISNIINRSNELTCCEVRS